MQPLEKPHCLPEIILHGSNCVPCCCTSVQYVNFVKYLGIFFCFDLSWYTHMTFVAKRLRSASCQLCNLKMFLQFAVRKLIMHTALLSFLIVPCNDMIKSMVFWRGCWKVCLTIYRYVQVTTSSPRFSYLVFMNFFANCRSALLLKLGFYISNNSTTYNMV